MKMSGSERDNEQIHFSYGNDDNDIDVPNIDEEDLADVQDDVDLNSVGCGVSLSGMSTGGLSLNDAASMELLSIAVPEKVVTARREVDPSGDKLRRGYIDDEILDDVMNSAQERIDIEKRAQFVKKLKIFGGVLVAFVLFALTTATFPPDEEKFIEEKIKTSGTAFDFDESEEYSPFMLDVNLAGKSFVMNETVDSEFDFPPYLGGKFVDIDSPPFDARTGQVPFFWQIPNSGSVVQSIMTSCLNLVLATSRPGPTGLSSEGIYTHSINDHQYVNVDLSNPQGIEHASRNNLVDTEKADALVTPLVHFAANLLLNTRHEGRLFTVMRHPIDRAVSNYKSFITLTNNPQLANMTLVEYASSNFFDDDWVTRLLSNTRYDLKVTHTNLQHAKEILRRKAVVGIYDKIEESMDMFEKYFGWTVTGPRHYSSTVCHEAIIGNAHNRDKDAYFNVGSALHQNDPAYNLVLEKNKYDMELYWYAHQLFEEQKEFVDNLSVLRAEVRENYNE